MSYQWIAEQRVARKYINLEVLSSYMIGKDGVHYFYEVILVDPTRPEIKTIRQCLGFLSPEIVVVHSVV